MSPVFSRSCRFQAHTAVSIVLFLVYQFTLLNCSQICSDASTACDLTPQQSLASQEDCISPILSSSAQLKEPQWGQDSVFKPQNANVCSKCCALPSNVDKTSACVGALNISAVGVKLVNYQHQLYVRFTSISYHGCQYSLTLKSLTNPSNALCKFYDVKYTQQVSFIDECFVELEANHTYDLNITSQESGYVRLYRFFSPSTLVTDDDISPGGIDWQPLTAITIYDKHIEVYIQRLPQPFPPYYVLELHYTNSDGIHLQGTLTRWLDGDADSVKWQRPGPTQANFLQVYTLEVHRCEQRPVEDVATSSGDFSCQLLQRHSVESSHIFTQRPDLGALDSMASSTTNDDVVSRSKSEKEPQTQELYILIGTIFGVIFLAIIIFVILFLYFKRRQGLGALATRFSGGNLYSDTAFFEEDIKDVAPTVLILYSYDCNQHLACVQSLALFLQNVLGCSVMTDFWATQEITERGIHMWLHNKIASVNYVIVVCSAGARFKSVTTRVAQLEETDDAYVTAMKLLQAQTDATVNQKLVAYFDYSSESDIPVLLENWQRFKLMSELDSLTSTILNVYNKGDAAFNNSIREHQQVYTSTLQEKINACKTYMTNNPNWFHVNLCSEPIAEQGREEQSTSPSQMLSLVTVEHARHGTTDSQVEPNFVNSKTTGNSVNVTQTRGLEHYPYINTLSSLQVHEPWQSPNKFPCSLSSYSSSLEDLEHDVDFILHPSLPTKSKSHSLPRHAALHMPNTLPQLPMLNQQYLMLNSDTSSAQGSLNIEL